MSKPISATGVINADGLTMTMETGRFANLVASVHTKVEGTELLSTAATAPAREGTDFFPLTVGCIVLVINSCVIELIIEINRLAHQFSTINFSGFRLDGELDNIDIHDQNIIV